MNKLRRILLAGAIGIPAAVATIAQAQTMSGHDHHAPPPAVMPAAAVKGDEMSEGEVRKLDMENRKITLKHGPLRNLDMPSMTMAFQVTDAVMLGRVKVGDKVRFVAANPGGKLTLTDIQIVQ